MKVLEYVIQEIELDAKKCGYQLNHIVDIKLSPIKFSDMTIETTLTSHAVKWPTGLSATVISPLTSNAHTMDIREDVNLTHAFWSEINTSWGIMIFTGTFPANLSTLTPTSTTPAPQVQPSPWGQSISSTYQPPAMTVLPAAAYHAGWGWGGGGGGTGQVVSSNSCPVCSTEAVDKHFSSFSFKYCPQCKEDIEFLSKKQQSA